jgi:hypothetical protein
LANKSILLTILLVWLCGVFVFSLYLLVTGIIIAPKYPFTYFNGLMALFLFGFLWIYLPNRIRRQYRKDPSQQGEMFVQLSSEGVSEKSLIGSSINRSWNVCSYWRESKRVIILMTHSGIYFTFPIACLNNEQQSELRGILTAALPKK